LGGAGKKFLKGGSGQKAKKEKGGAPQSIATKMTNVGEAQASRSSGMGGDSGKKEERKARSADRFEVPGKGGGVGKERSM